MNKELLAIHTETQIIKAIGERLLDQFSMLRLHLEKGDDETYIFIDDQIKSFVVQSELAYQFLFPSVDKFLQRVRHFQASVNTICYESKPLVCLDAYISQHQLILKEALETLESYRLIHEAAQLTEQRELEQLTQSEPVFIDMSQALVKQAIQGIYEDVSDDLNRKQIHGIVEEDWLADFLIFRKEDFKRAYCCSWQRQFSKNQFSQIIDIALGRVKAAYNFQQEAA